MKNSTSNSTSNSNSNSNNDNKKKNNKDDKKVKKHIKNNDIPYGMISNELTENYYSSTYYDSSNDCFF